MFVHYQTGLKMNRELIDSFVIFFLAIILVSSCAKVSSPAGGPRDKRPPVVVKTTPPNASVNYSGKEFEIIFDEYVVLDKINEKFMVSPPMKKKPEVNIKGKGIVVKYEDELHENTTYTFDFSDAVKDINEGNVYANLQFVFSTGPVIDSLSVTGNLQNTYVLDAPANPLVILYRNLSDTAVRKMLPDYISRADKNGYFRINNVMEGKYRLYALADNDNSRTFNIADEAFAFLNEPVEVTSSKNYIAAVKDTVKKVKPKSEADTVVLKGEYRLIMFQHEKTLHYLTSSSRNLPYLLTYILSLPPRGREFNVSIPGSNADTYFTDRNRNNDTLRVWITDSTLFSQQLISTLLTYPYTDSAGITKSRQDTISMRFIAPRSTRAQAKPAPYQVKSNIPPGGSLKPGQEIVFESITPLRPPDTSKIRLYEIKEAEKITLPYSFIKDSTNSCRIMMKASFERGRNYLYIADSAAFGNIYGESADSTGMRINVREDKTFGKLVLNIKGYEGSRIIQLLDKSEKQVREIKADNDGKIEFPLLEKGAYRIRVVYDLNNDGRWTTGDFAAGLQPEPVSFYPQELEIKEDWVMDQDWDISVKNVKKLKSIPRPSQGR